MKKALSLVLCLMLVLGLLAACGGSDSSSAGAGSSADDASGSVPAGDDSGAEAVDWDTHETFSWWLYATPNDYYSSYSENPVIQYLNHKFNVTLEFEQPAAGTEADSLSLMFGTGEYTDAIDMSYYTGSASQLFADGVLVDIAQYLDYMPNFKQRLEADEGFRKTSYDDDGRILTLRMLSEEDEIRWGGLVYRRDILDTMTGGSIAFPSGNEAPTTIEDWEYMLPLMKTYFEAASMPEYAPLILPANGYFASGELTTGFGVNSSYYLDNGQVKYGPMEEGFYNYLQKMKEWYEAGYIYQDFASRTNDLFYLPNTALTYGGAAGAWFGLSSQVGDVMSMPEYELYFDVDAASDPLDTEHGIEAAFPFGSNPYYDAGSLGLAITTACEDVPKLLSVLDYMYSEEGGMFRNYGLTAEQAAEAGVTLYETAGLNGGVYTLENGEFAFNSALTAGGGELNAEPFIGIRLPNYNRNSYNNETVREEERDASDIWNLYKDSGSGTGKLPSALSRPVDEDKTYTDNNTTILDYVDSMVPKFIMGTEELSEDSFAAFVEQLKAYGIEENLRIQQEAYDRYLAR